FPGSGSLLAGRRVGYAQMAVMTLGFALSTGCGVPLLVMWVRLKSFPFMPDEWLERGIPPAFLRLFLFTFVGIVLFIISWCWSILTGLLIMSEAKSSPPPLK
ncbi:MAG: hypothetical protein HY300_13395, partial [Verrucomicrobia bacterium]|nr:hypothetical protein [Verrucomicrobiota bacterium]